MVVLGQTVVEKLFGASADPVGQTVRIRNIPFQVVAVLAKKGQSPSGQDYDDAVFVPRTTFQAKIQGGLQKFIAGAIFVERHADATTAREADRRELLRDRHRIGRRATTTSRIRNLAEMASAQEEGTPDADRCFLASIAAVSLLVGGIGIMNIMLVSVTERTREIGVRMAVGAKPRHILRQFLVEALALAVAGGVARRRRRGGSPPAGSPRLRAGRCYRAGT